MTVLFYDESGGGVTFSGGEPLSQWRFLLACLASRRNAAASTLRSIPAGSPRCARSETVARATNLFLYDLKVLDPERHLRYTGVPLDPILRNLRALDRAGATIWIRVPLIPAYNDDRANLTALGALVAGLSQTRRVHLLPYHRLGSEKHACAGAQRPHGSGGGSTEPGSRRASRPPTSGASISTFASEVDNSMNPRIERLRQRSLEAQPAISDERSLLMTEFYRDHLGKHSAPVLRALAFRNLCALKTITIEPDELIVGERGPTAKATPLYPELTCHSIEDLRALDGREKTSYAVSPETFARYEDTVIPYWRGRSLRDRIFASLPPEWHAAYDAGLFTEFMEQRAPGHTVGRRQALREGHGRLQGRYPRGDDAHRPRRRSAGGGAARGAARHGHCGRCRDPLRRAPRRAGPASWRPARSIRARRAELERIAEVCTRVPAQTPRDFWEAIQMYWFCHLGVITELNGWDAFSPGHLDQHLEPF